MVILRKCLICMFALFFFLGLGRLWFVQSRYQRVLPRAPDKEAGRIYPVRLLYCQTHYGTVVEANSLRYANAVAMAGVLCGVAAGLLNLRYNDFPPPGSKRDHPLPSGHPTGGGAQKGV